jgi:phage terminase small subunit
MSELTGNKLTAKQKKLVDTLVAKGCSIKDASKDAGYSEKTECYESTTEYSEAK